MSAPRPTWTGVLQISLVTIPIKVFPATSSAETLSFHQLHSPCQTRIQQKKSCPSCRREVPTEEIVKGFEFEPDRYVILLPEELEAVQPPSTKVIALTQFAPLAALPWRAIDRGYFLAPDGPEGGPASQAYTLMAEAMSGTVGIGKVAIYGREYLVAVGPEHGTLMLSTLHHAAELRASPVKPGLNVVTRNTGRELAEVRLAHQVIAALRGRDGGRVDLAAFTDQYQVDLQRLIAAKIAGDEIVVPRVPAPPPVVNLREALEQSLRAVHATTTPSEKLPMAKVALKRKRA